MPQYVTQALGHFNRDPHLDDSRVRDYLFFCVERQSAWPPFPVTVAKLTRFLFFILRARRLGGGWSQVKAWHVALCRWFCVVQRDPFTTVDEAVYIRVRNSFSTVPQRRLPKAPVTASLFAAIWELLDSGSELHELERTLFLLYYVGGFRAATFCLGSDRRGRRRLVRLGHISFFRNDGRLHAFIVMPETKTTESWQPVGHVLRPRPDDGSDPTRCAVCRLQHLCERRRACGATDNDAVFVNPRNRRPYSRNVFAEHLKIYVDAVASRFVLGIRLPLPPSYYVSGISFRKGVLSRLSAAGVPAQLVARFANHRSISSQMAYVAETFEAVGLSADDVYGSF